MALSSWRILAWLQRPVLQVPKMVLLLEVLIGVRVAIVIHRFWIWSDTDEFLLFSPSGTRGH